MNMTTSGLQTKNVLQKLCCLFFNTLNRYLANNEHLITKLAESYPFRRAAQLTAYFYHRGKDISVENLEKLRDADIARRMIEQQKEAGNRFDSFKRTVSKELKDGFRDMKEEMNKKK